MSWREAVTATPMARVAVVAPEDRLRDVLVTLADAGVVEVEEIRDHPRSPAGEALERALTARGGSRQEPSALLSANPPDLDELRAAGRISELVGESEIERVGAQTVRRCRSAALTGWCPRTALPVLSRRLQPYGGAAVALPTPSGSLVPTLLRDRRLSRPFQPLVDTYGIVPYEDVNPAAFAGLTYAVMFGMMFGDVGDGLLVVAAALLLRARRPASLARFAHLAPFVLAAGLASTAFGFLYGEAFGPTGLVGALWLHPLDHPTTLLAVGIAFGGVLLAASYLLGIINRWKESGAARAIVAMSGVAGTAVYLGLGVVGLGWYLHEVPMEATGALMALAGGVLGYLGCFAEAGRKAVGAFQAAIEMFDATVRIGSNTVSFARLAAFGLTHAALCQVTWQGTTTLGHHGPALWVLAAVLFVVGNAVAFLLEGLVAAVQALRLEYYEMFSRIFVREGRKFRPWQIPTAETEEVTCSAG